MVRCCRKSTSRTPIELPNGQSLLLEPLVRSEYRLGLDGFDPCAILLNNDLSAGIPEILRNLNEQFLLPPLHSGWAVPEALLRDRLSALDLNWISGRDPHTHWVYTAKPRYRTPDMPCEIDAIHDGRAEIAFAQPQWALTPGQSVVVYESMVCLGGGIIA